MSALDGHVAVVTGAGRGIGRAIAIALADAGAAVIISARNTAEIEDVARAIVDAGGRAVAIPCDVTDENAVAQMASDAAAHFGSVDILVNNAGVGHSALLHRTTLEDWDRVMRVNATAAFLCMRAFMPAMVAGKWGRIVNVSSVAGLSAQRYISAYAASKHALIGLTRAAAAESAGSGVTVNAVCPGFADTAMTDRSVSNVMRQTGRSADQALALVLATTGQTRLVTPAEIARAVLALCEPGSDAMNGEAIIIDGGSDRGNGMA